MSDAVQLLNADDWATQDLTYRGEATDIEPGVLQRALELVREDEAIEADHARQLGLDADRHVVALLNLDHDYREYE